MGIVHQFAFEVGLIEVDGLLSFRFLRALLFLFFVSVEDVAELVGQLLFQHFWGFFTIILSDYMGK